jgi:hypothetical protein
VTSWTSIISSLLSDPIWLRQDMKILGISCSRRKLRNTDILVHHALKGASSETQHLALSHIREFILGMPISY